MLKPVNVARLLVGLALVFGVSSCSKAASDAPTVKPTYDPKTGKLTRLEADLTKDGKPDTWTYTDGTTPLRTEQDLNQDGKIERWEWVDPDGKITKVLASATGSADKISRWESYNHGLLIKVEEDTNGDGRPDQWEKHIGVPILSVEFDRNFDGIPDERWTYGTAGAIESIETEPDGAGRYLKTRRPGK